MASLKSCHWQVSILFAELPKFLPLLPCTVPLALLEQELERPEEPNLRMLFLRMNRQLREPQGAWRFRRNEVLVVLQAWKTAMKTHWKTWKIIGKPCKNIEKPWRS